MVFEAFAAFCMGLRLPPQWGDDVRMEALLSGQRDPLQISRIPGSVPADMSLDPLHRSSRYLEIFVCRTKKSVQLHIHAADTK
jgi:hypothetical protein